MPRTRPVLHAPFAASSWWCSRPSPRHWSPCPAEPGAALRPRPRCALLRRRAERDSGSGTNREADDGGHPLPGAPGTGSVVGMRFWKDESARGIRVGSRLWNGNGKRLARVVFDEESSRGWRRGHPEHPGRRRPRRPHLPREHAVLQRSATCVAPGYRHTSHSAALALRRGLAGGAMVHTSAPGRSAARRGPGAVFVDVLFSPTTSRPAHAAPRHTTSDATSTPHARERRRSHGLEHTHLHAEPCAVGHLQARCPRPVATPTAPNTEGRRRARCSPGCRVRRPPAPAGRGTAPTTRVFVSGSGAVLDSLDIAGAVVIDAPNVVVSRTRAMRHVRRLPRRRGRRHRALLVRRCVVPRLERDDLQGNEIIGTPAGCTHRARSGSATSTARHPTCWSPATTSPAPATASR